MTTQNFYGPVGQVAGNNINNRGGGDGTRRDRASELYQRGQWHEAQRDKNQLEANACQAAALYGPLSFVGAAFLITYLSVPVGYGLLAIPLGICADLRRMQLMNARRAELLSKCRMHNAAIVSINDEIARL